MAMRCELVKCVGRAGGMALMRCKPRYAFEGKMCIEIDGTAEENNLNSCKIQSEREIISTVRI